MILKFGSYFNLFNKNNCIFIIKVLPNLYLILTSMNLLRPLCGNINNILNGIYKCLSILIETLQIWNSQFYNYIEEISKFHNKPPSKITNVNTIILCIFFFFTDRVGGINNLVLLNTTDSDILVASIFYALLLSKDIAAVTIQYGLYRKVKIHNYFENDLWDNRTMKNIR